MAKKRIDVDTEILQKARQQTGLRNHTDLIHHALNNLLEPKESPERYRTILEQIQEGYYEVDLAGNLTFFTIPYAIILGYSHEELMGMNNRRYMDRDNAKKVFLAYNEIYRTGISTKHVDWELIKKDGSRIFVETSVTLMRDTSGTPVGFQGIVRDITGRKRMEEELRKSEERYRTILENTEEGYYEMDLTGSLTFNNALPYKILGYTEEELKGMNYRQHMDKENAKNVFRVFSEVYQTGIPARVVYEQIKKNGDRLFVETSVTLMRNSSGQPVGFRGIVHDVSERKRMEDALEESEKKYRSILENIEEGYYEVDLGGNLQFFNRTLNTILGYTEEEMRGMNYRRYMDAETAKTTFHAFNEVYRTGIPTKHLDWELIKKDGGRIIVETSVAPIKDASGQLVGFRGVTHDVTVRKQMEEEIKRLSITDPLTDLYNRRGFMTLAEQQLKISERIKRGLILVFADLDDLKIINDTLGHRKGDDALVEAADIFREVFRQSDVLARMGGDEFAILALETSSSPRETPAVLTDRLQRCIDRHNAQANRDYPISMSIGIVFHDPEPPCFIDELMSRADALMYEQKKRKREYKSR
jgi:diguanylate cyclase (GGDEF)-like protein/PAS domain S-box-containing protein